MTRMLERRLLLPLHEPHLAGLCASCSFPTSTCVHVIMTREHPSLCSLLFYACATAAYASMLHKLRISTQLMSMPLLQLPTSARRTTTA